MLESGNGRTPTTYLLHAIHILEAHILLFPSSSSSFIIAASRIFSSSSGAERPCSFIGSLGVMILQHCMSSGRAFVNLCLVLYIHGKLLHDSKTFNGQCYRSCNYPTIGN